MDEMNVMPVPAENQVAETDEQKLARLATEINTIKVQVQAVVQNATLEIGQRLTQAKAAVPHGSSRLLASSITSSCASR